MALTPEEHITFVLKKRVGWSRERAPLVKGCSFNVRTTRLRLDPQNPRTVQHWESGVVWMPGTHWPVSPAYLVVLGQ